MIRIEIFSWIRIRIWILIRWMGSTALVRIRITFIQYANILLLLQKYFKKNLKAWIASIRTTRTLRYDFMFVVAAFLHNATSSSCFRRCRACFDLPFELSISSSCVSWNWYLFVSNVFRFFLKGLDKKSFEYYLPWSNPRGWWRRPVCCVSGTVPALSTNLEMSPSQRTSCCWIPAILFCVNGGAKIQCSVCFILS